MTSSMKLFRLSWTVIILAFSFIYAQQDDYKDTIWVKVTFYDFHSDRSNPEFECPHDGRLQRGMVEPYLDADMKPVLGPNPFINYFIKYWYRDWKNGGGQGDFDRPVYNRNDYVRTTTVNHDTSFKNIVIDSFLVFNHRGNGVYEYVNNSFFPLDNQGFGNENLSHNYSFTMELHREFIKTDGLTFSFTGDDDVWVFIDGRLVLDLGGIHTQQNGSFNLDTIPWLENGKVYTLSFFFAERHTTESNIKITTNIISASLVDIKLIAEPDTTVQVYDTVRLRSEVRDDTLGIRDEVAANTQWRILDGDGNPDSVLKSRVGSEVLVVPTVAWSTIVLEGMVTDGKVTLKDTIRIKVTHGPPYAISIEANFIDSTTADTSTLRFPQPLDQIIISNSMTSADAYAVVRDRSGAFVRMADPITASWGPPPPAGDGIISATGEELPQPRKFHGIVSRINSGTTYAYADEGTLLRDSVLVIVAPYDILRLRVVERGNSVIDNYVDTIRMNTDQKKLYDVYGLKSTATDTNDIDSWVLVNADWDLSSPLNSAVPPSKGLSYWTYDPTNPGTGTLTLTNPNDANTQTLIIPVIIDRAPPSLVEFKLITPANQRRAGETLLAVVEIRNTDGLVPGQYCFGNGGDDPSRVVYQDTMSRGGAHLPDPTISVDGINGTLNTGSMTTHTNDQCFIDGLDTVQVVLYNAPYTKEKHQLVVTLNPNLIARTEPFVLLPGPLDSLVITDANFIPIPGPIQLDSRISQSITVYSTGYDRFGNLIDFQNSTWSTDGTLNPHNDFGASTYLGTENVKTHQQGNLCAAANGENGEVKACIPVIITGPGALLSRAVTRDIDGNGLLDRIDLIFDKPVNIPPEAIPYFSVTRNNVVFVIDSIVPRAPGDTVFYLYLREDTTGHLPQTAWQLNVKIQAFQDLNQVSLNTEDGAPPVVWYVEKEVKSIDHTKDVLTVKFSEKILGGNGNAFNVLTQPDLVLNVWQRNPETQQFEYVNLLADIQVFTYAQDDIVKLVTTNGMDITNANWVNIRDESFGIQDASKNFPTSVNQKVNVNVKGQKTEIKAFPNPIRPDFRAPGTIPGPINLVYEPNAVNWAKTYGGTAIRARIAPPSEGTVYGSFKIYDLVGNLVNYAVKQDLLAGAQSKGLNTNGLSIVDLLFYWNGSTYKGAKAAPGVYKAILYLDYTGQGYKDEVLTTNLGVGK